MANIFHHFVVKSPVTKVYEAISQLDGLKSWWTVDTTGDPQKDGQIRFGFGGEMYNKMRVTAAEKNKLISWKCIEGPEDWVGTNLSFTLSEDKDKNTIVKFQHNDWKEANDFYGSCNYHWGLFMKSLKSLCETGKGTPHGA
jgi:uncharacterized protein YndB with AHSA1/START domain